MAVRGGVRCAHERPMMNASLDLGEPVGRLAQLFAETVVPQPYAVTDKIVIRPPTKASREAMANAQAALLLYQALFNQAVIRKPDDDGPAPTNDELNALSQLITDSQRDWNVAFFGDQYDNVEAFFGDKSPELWEAFVADIRQQFLPTSPSDGRCRTCGHVDEEQAGKGETSST